VKKMLTFSGRYQIMSNLQASEGRVEPVMLSGKLNESPDVSTIICCDNLVMYGLLSNSMSYVVVFNLEFIILGKIANNMWIDLRVLGSRALQLKRKQRSSWGLEKPNSVFLRFSFVLQLSNLDLFNAFVRMLVG
jgi:hypothetical protein